MDENENVAERVVQVKKEEEEEEEEEEYKAIDIDRN
jgi:hypothetical protein